MRDKTILISLFSLTCTLLSPAYRTDYSVHKTVLRAWVCFRITIRTAPLQNQASSKVAGIKAGWAVQLRRPDQCAGVCLWPGRSSLRQAQLVCLLNFPSKVIWGDCGFALSKTPLTARNLKTNNIILLGYPSRWKQSVPFGLFWSQLMH